MKSHNTKSVLDELRAKGFRMTPQRMMVLEAVEASEDHISAEEIFKQAHAKYPYLNISTVYRTLEMMKEQGLVAESDLGGGGILQGPALKGLATPCERGSGRGASRPNRATGLSTSR